MNERIKQLLKEAGIIQPERFNAVDGSNQLEKFAELIVKECILNIDSVKADCDHEHWRSAIDVAHQRVTKHFGID